MAGKNQSRITIFEDRNTSNRGCVTVSEKWWTFNLSGHSACGYWAFIVDKGIAFVCGFSNLGCVPIA